VDEPQPGGLVARAERAEAHLHRARLAGGEGATAAGVSADDEAAGVGAGESRSADDEVGVPDVRQSHRAPVTFAVVG